MDGVSVIICCYNSASRLGETLRHLVLQNQVSTPWEIIIVDNASTDNTKDIAGKLWIEQGRNDVTFRIVDQPIRGLAFARTKGIETSSYDILIFCDDDNWLENSYIQNAYEIASSNPKIGALGGIGIPASDSALPVWFDRYKYSFACYPQGETDGELTNPTASLYGAGLVIKRDVLKKLESRGFTPLLTDRIGERLTSGGDTELCFAIRLAGYKLWFSTKLKFYHYIPAGRLTMQYLYRLNESLAYCSASLIIYRYVLLGKKVNSLVWWKDMCYQLFLFSNSLRRFLNLTAPVFERKLDIGYSYNSLRSFLHQFGKYDKQSREIEKLKI